MVLTGLGGIHRGVGIVDVSAGKQVGIVPVEFLALVVEAGVLHEESVTHVAAFLIPAVDAGVVLSGSETAVLLDFALGQLQDLTLVVRDVQSEVPDNVVGADDVAVEVQFHTAVADVADVRIVTTCAVALGDVQPEEQVGGLLVVEVDATVQAVAEEAPLQTHVEVVRGLPGDVLVTQTGKGGHDVGAVAAERVHICEVPAADAVVTLLAERHLELQLVHPVSTQLLEEFLLVDEPSAADAPEVTPAMVLVEIGRGIAAVGYGAEVALVEVIEGIGEPAFAVELARVGIAVVAVAEGVDFQNLGREAVAGVSLHVFGARLVPLVTEHHLHVVLAEELVEGQRLDVVLTEVVALVLCEAAIVSLVRTFEGVLVVRVVRQAEVEVVGAVEAQPVREDDVGRVGLVQLMTFHGVGVVAVAAQRVTGRHESARGRADIAVRGHTVVILVVAELVLADDGVAVGIQHADVNGIDGSDVGGEVHQVGSTPAGVHIRVAVGVAVGVAYVGSHLQPLLDLIVSLQAGVDALVAGIFDDTVFLQVACAGEEAALTAAGADVDIVLLAEGRAVGSVCPVVGCHEVCLAVGSGVAAAQRGVGVDTSVTADKVLSGRHVVDIVAQTVQRGIVGGGAGSSGAHALNVEIVVVHHAIVRLIVLRRILDGLVVLNGAGVGAPLHVYVDDGLLCATLLRGDENHACGTCGTVQGSRGSIFQHRDALDIIGVDVCQAGIVRRTVHDDEGLHGRIQRADTADIHAAAASTGGTALAHHLQARNLTDEGVSDIRRGFLLQVVGIDDRGRTGEGLARLLTESNDHDFIEQALVGVQSNTHTVAGFHHATEHTDVGDFQTSVGTRHRDGEVTVEIGHGTSLLAKDLDGSTRQGLSIVGRDNGALHLSLGDCHSYT